MAAWGYEFYLRVLKVSLTSERQYPLFKKHHPITGHSAQGMIKVITNLFIEIYFEKMSRALELKISCAALSEKNATCPLDLSNPFCDICPA